MDEFVKGKMAQGYDDSEILASFGRSMTQGGEDEGTNALRTQQDVEAFEAEQVEMLREHLASKGQAIPDAGAFLGNDYDAFEAEHQKRARTLYEGDQIIVKRLRQERLQEIEREKRKAVQTTSAQRNIEPGDQAGFKSSKSMLIDPATFRPE